MDILSIGVTGNGSGGARMPGIPVPDVLLRFDRRGRGGEEGGISSSNVAILYELDVFEPWWSSKMLSEEIGG